tara:strand:- start:1283 stop:2191 length:909 start_codon:yes stop_codon:yes gene_type:complete
MHIYIGLPIALLVMAANSPIFALIGGIFFSTVLRPPKNFIPDATGANLLKTGIVILGLTIPLSTATGLTSSYFFYISVYVLMTFFVGILLTKILKIDFKLGLLISSGTAICGATAMAAVSQVINVRPKELLISIGIIFLFNAFAIVAFPIIGKNLDMSFEQFGFFAAMAIHDTGSVVGAAMAYGDGALDTAATLKLLRTLWLIPLIIVLGIFYKGGNSKPQTPLFITFFVLAIFIGTTLNLGNEITALLKVLSNALILGALFCIGTQINIKSMSAINVRNFSFALILWLVALIFSFLFIYIY